MKNLLICMILLSSLSSFGAELTKSDYEKIKTAVSKQSSKSMIKSKIISKNLYSDAIDEIYITTDILSTKESVTAKAIVLPAEDNCGCQDVFEVSMKINKINNYWKVTNESIKIKNLDDDQ